MNFRITQSLEGADLRVLYLAERVCYQLVGTDAPRVLMDPPQFMLALLSMTNDEYQLWRSSIPYAEWLVDDLDYAKFSEIHLMPSLSAEVCILSFSLPFSSLVLSCTW